MPDMWMDVDTALSEVPVNIMPLLDDTDFTTRETAIVYNQAGMDLVWNFVTTAGAMSQTAVTPTTAGDYDWANQGDGMYSIEIPSSGGASINNDTEGFGWFTGVCTGVLPWRGPIIGFRASGLNNLLIDSAYSATRGLSGTAMPDAAADAAGGLPISDAGGLDIDTLLGRITGNVALASVLGALTDAAADGDPTTADTLMQYMKQLINVLIGTSGVVAFPAEAAPANNVSLAEVIRAIHADVTGLNGDAMRGTDSALLAASAPTNFGDLAITATTGRVDVASIEGGDATDQINAAADTALSDYDAPTYDELLAFVQLLARSDSAIATDRSTELSAINTDEGSGAGDYGNTTESLEGIRDRGDSAWITGGGGGITDILNVQPLIPYEIDLANTATYRLGLMLFNALDDLPSTTEITPGTISIDRKAIGATSWTSIVADAACSELAGLIYYDEVFDSGTGYAEGDSIRITFKSQLITVAANDYEITDSNGRIFYTSIRQTMRGTDSAFLAASAPANFSDLAITATTGRVDVASIEGSDATDQIRDAVVDDATRIDASALNTLSGHDPGSQIAAQSDISGLNDPTAAAVADAVWDEAKAGHVGAGSFGEEVQAHALSSEVSALNDLSAAEVNAEVDTALSDYDAPTYDELLAFVQLLARSDSAIATDRSTELTAINTDQGSGAGNYDNATESLEGIRDRGDSAWITGGGGSASMLLQSTTIATLTSQTAFTLAAGSTDDDAYNKQLVIITDQSTSTQKAVGVISDYDGSTRGVTLLSDPGIFTMAVGDTVEILAIGATAYAVWSYSQRTLTQAAATVTAAVSGSTITIKRGDTFTASITGLGPIADRTKLYFTVKTKKDDDDDESIIQIEETAGLIYFNGAAGTPANGSIVVDDEDAGDITITLAAEDTDDLSPANEIYYDVQKVTASAVATMTEGEANITEDVTRAIT